MKSEKYAFFYGSVVVYEMTKDNCDFIDIPFDVKNNPVALVWKKHLPHRHFFDYFIKKLKENGQIDKILNKWKPVRSDCGTGGDFESMGLENIVSAFAMMGAGLVLALFILWGEYSCRYLFKQVKNRHSTANLIENDGTQKLVRDVKIAKNLPRNRVETISSEKFNLPLFAFEVMTEMEAATSDGSGPLSDAAILGKIRHLKNVLEVCCLNFSDVKYKGHRWTLAKAYAVKDEDEIEQKLLEWDDTPAGVMNRSLASAQEDYPSL